MKKFILKTILFFLPLISISYKLDSILSNRLKRSNSHAQGEFPTWNAIFNKELNSEIYVMGSSRAWTQIDPKIIEDSVGLSCYNLGVDGHPFWIQNLRYILAESKNPSPKMLIQEVDIGTFNMRKELYNSDQFLPYMLWNDTIKQFIEKLEGYSYLDYYIPLLRYYAKTDAFKIIIKETLFTNSNPVKRVNGYQGQTEKWNGDFDRAKKKMNAYKAFVDSSVFNLFRTYLENLKKNDIDVILTYPPEYFEASSFVENKSEWIKIFKKLSNEFEFEFIDFSDDSISYSKQYFINATHLNKKGAELYTRKLTSKIKELSI
tara:strand:+ start:1672 stop:2625 length:954 start_codon:yes stop_codon:yes gene_type:complete